jgi:hypothetical protein
MDTLPNSRCAGWISPGTGAGFIALGDALTLDEIEHWEDSSFADWWPDPLLTGLVVEEFHAPVNLLPD